MKKNYTPAFLIMWLFSTVLFLSEGCKKYVDEVPDNVPPPDQTIENVTIESYVSKTYISVLGREPDSAGFANGINILNQHNVSEADRDSFLTNVFSNPEYKDHLYGIARVDLLNNLDTNVIAQYIFIFTPLLMDSAYILQWDAIQNEITRLTKLRNVPTDLLAGTCDVIEMHRRCVNNFFYDDINMGTANFVVSVFQNLLNRYPTVNELSNAIIMVDGSSSTLFLQSGQSKDDFLNIFFSSDNYFEGLVRDLYQRYLFRDANSVEMNTATLKFSGNGHDYVQMQKDILSSNEFIGIH